VRGWRASSTTVRLLGCAIALLTGPIAMGGRDLPLFRHDSYSGKVIVETRAATANGETSVDVTGAGDRQVVRFARLAVLVSGDRHLAGRRDAVGRG